MNEKKRFLAAALAEAEAAQREIQKADATLANSTPKPSCSTRRRRLSRRPKRRPSARSAERRRRLPVFVPAACANAAASQFGVRWTETLAPTQEPSHAQNAPRSEAHGFWPLLNIVDTKKNHRRFLEIRL